MNSHVKIKEPSQESLLNLRHLEGILCITLSNCRSIDSCISDNKGPICVENWVSAVRMNRAEAWKMSAYPLAAFFNKPVTLDVQILNWAGNGQCSTLDIAGLLLPSSQPVATLDAWRPTGSLPVAMCTRE